MTRKLNCTSVPIHWFKSNSVVVDENFNLPNLDEFYKKSIMSIYITGLKLDLNKRAFEVPTFSRYHTKTSKKIRKQRKVYL